MKIGNGVLCPNCGNNQTQVKDSRPGDRTIRRRRYCETCHARFTTYEVQAGDIDALEKAVYFGQIFRQIPDARRRLIEQLLVEFGHDVPPEPPPRLFKASYNGMPRLEGHVLGRLLAPSDVVVDSFNLIEAVRGGNE